jgi:hypothetical protein
LGRDKRKHKGIAYSKKGDQINHRYKKYESCRQKFKENGIHTAISMYILEASGFIKKKKKKGDHKENCEIHEHDMRSKYDLHTQSRNTSLLQKSVLHMGVRLYKHLPLKIKKLDNFNRFRKKSEINFIE